MANLSISYKYLTVSTVSFGISYGLMLGTVQKYIHFSNPLAEMAVCICAFCIGLSAAFCIFSKRGTNC